MPLVAKRCLRCKHEWWPRTPNRPGVCPACKRKDWDQPITKRPGQRVNANRG